MKTDKISFGTTPKIGVTSAILGLPKYKMNLTAGIYDAFEKLAKNGIDDEITAIIGPLKTNPIKNQDIIEFDYWTENGSMYQSSKTFKLKELEKKPKEKITEIILNAYEYLKKNSEKSYSIKEYPENNKYQRIVTKQQRNIISILTEKFGFDDWLCG